MRGRGSTLFDSMLQPVDLYIHLVPRSVVVKPVQIGIVCGVHIVVEIEDHGITVESSDPALIETVSDKVPDGIVTGSGDCG